MLDHSQRLKKILEKTDGRCYICGDQIDNISERNIAVLNGQDMGNSAYCLLAHKDCIALRGKYKPEEWQSIIEIGIAIHIREKCSHRKLPRIEQRQPINANRKKTVYKKTNGLCAICSGPLKKVPEKITVDHLVPLIGGGRNEIRNLLPAHYDCNRKKWWFYSEDWKRILSRGKLGYEKIMQNDPEAAVIKEILEEYKKRLEKRRKRNVKITFKSAKN